MEDALYEIDSVWRFAEFTSITDALPDETTILTTFSSKMISRIWLLFQVKELFKYLDR